MKQSLQMIILFFGLGNTFMGIYAKTVIWEYVNTFGSKDIHHSVVQIVKNCQPLKWSTTED